ncbi:MAG: hypothetical protein LQ350_006952 [Teloschistes chrysophthalmus]|nr:MAG: hypothetical protein LQ350_006952 [Niorma chrysophthalma]
MRPGILLSFLLALVLHIPTAFSASSGNLQCYKRRDFPPPLFCELTQKAEPQIARDIDDKRPHPTHLDQVFTAIYDALQIVLIVLDKIDDDKDIYPHYFARRDRAKVAEVFHRLAGYCSTGNAMMSQVTIQITDEENTCEALRSGLPEAYSFHPTRDAPKVVLCPVAFHKKAFTLLNGVPGNPEDLPEHYQRCQEVIGGGDGGHVSYRIVTLGAILLHEYMHLDYLLDDIYGKPIIDEIGDNGRTMYGSHGVYDSPSIKTHARTNADSYTFYALNVFWDEVCQFEFSAPRPGDSTDPDVSTTPVNDLPPPAKREELNETETGGWDGRADWRDFFW